MNPDQSMFATANDKASQIATIGWIVMIGFTIVSLAMWGLLVWAARRRPGTFDEHAPAELEDGKGWLIVGGIIIPGITFACLLVVGIVRMHTASPSPHHHMAQPEIKIVGHRWWWEVQYLGQTPEQTITSANEVHIPVGHPVTIDLESADVIHSFWVPNLHGKVDLVPGHHNEISIEADAPGRYLGQCAEFCGLQHANMKLVVVAQERDDYIAWRMNEWAPAKKPTSALAIRGQEVFEAKPCAVCHTIRGTAALGRVGPDLTHLATRGRLATNVYPLTPAYLAAWSTRAHSLKPGVEMPDLTALTGDELTALTAYLLDLDDTTPAEPASNGDAQVAIDVSEGMSSPEAILVDPIADVYLVSNINGSPHAADDNGYISRVSPTGKVLVEKWIDGASDGVTLHAPRGMAIRGDTLYVVDLDAVRLFDRRTGVPKASWPIPDPHFPNDIRVDDDGSVYVTETGIHLGPTGPVPEGASKIWRFDTHGNPTAIAQGDELGGPNGIVLTKNGIVFVTFMAESVLRLVNGHPEEVAKLPFGQLDGLVELSDGSFLVTSWLAKGIYRVKTDGTYQLVMHDSSIVGAASIDYDAKRGRLLVPLVLANKLLFEPYPVH